MLQPYNRKMINASVQQRPQQVVVYQPSPPSVAQFPQSMGQTNFTGNHSVELSCCEQADASDEVVLPDLSWDKDVDME